MNGDIEDLNKDFKPIKNDHSLYIEFKSLPGEVSATSHTQYFSNTFSFDANPIVKNMANIVFPLKFNKLVYGEAPKDLKTGFYVLQIDAEANASAVDGGHTAKLNTVFLDANKNILVTSKAEQVVYSAWIAQKKTMTRAFYRAFHDILKEIEIYMKNIETNNTLEIDAK